MYSYTTQRIKNIIFLILISAGSWYLLEGYKIQVILTAIPLLFSLQIIFTDLVEYYLATHTRRQTRWFNLLIAPGTILHELSHFFAALITGCMVMKVSLFKPNPKT